MSDIHRDEIIYEEGWRESAPAQEPQELPVDEAAEKPMDKPHESKPLLLIIQLALCLALVLALFLLKSMDSDIYHDFMDHYRDELSKPVVSQGVFDSVDIGRLFGEGAVTVKATPDEAEDS